MESEIKEEENKVEKLVSNVIECMETRFDLVAIDVQDKVSEILASIATSVFIGILITFTVLLLSIGAAMYISNYYESVYVGFIYVAVFYFFLTCIVFLFRKKLIKLPLINGLLKKLNFHEEN